MMKYFLSALTLFGLGLLLSRKMIFRVVPGDDDGSGDKLTVVIAVGNIGSQMWLHTQRNIPDQPEDPT